MSSGDYHDYYLWENIPLWRKILIVIFLLLVLAPPLISIYYSAFTHTAFGLTFCRVGFYLCPPYFWFDFYVAPLLIIAVYFIGRWQQKKKE